MKTFKSIIPALALLLMFGTAKANQKDDGAASRSIAINTYVDVMARGKLNGFTDVLDQGVQFTIGKKH